LGFEWQWKKYTELSQSELYEILKVRQAVFVVEQNCIYQDIDELDKEAWHLLALSKPDSSASVLAAYLRVIFPGYKHNEAAMGRVLVSQAFRGTGLGKVLVKKGIAFLELEIPKTTIRISAQQYLTGFYTELGFVTCSSPYDEDGILHVEMIRNSVSVN